MNPSIAQPVSVPDLMDQQSPQQLLEAFEQFGRLSEQLQQSYQELDERAAALTRELAAAKDERLKQLAEKEKLADRLEKLLTALPAGVVVIDETGQIKSANKAAEEFLEQSLAGKNWHHVMKLAVQSSHQPDITLKNGRILNLTQTCLDSDEGEMILINDVSQQRMLQTMAARQNRLAAMGEMAAGLAHQLRTPLSSAVLYASHIGQPRINTALQQKAGEKIRTSLRYLEKLINDMLMYAKGGEFGDASFNVNQLLVSFKSRMEARLLQHNVCLTIDSQVGDCQLKGSQDALVSVLCNLAENAMEACEQNCRIELRAYLKDEHLILAMHDNGPGLSEEQQLHIFEPFYSERQGGTGLGLAVAQSIAQAHKGDLLVKSRPGEGCTFFLCLSLEQGDQFLPSGQSPFQNKKTSQLEERV